MRQVPVIGRWIERLQNWVTGLSRGWLVAGGSALALVAIFASLGMYRVYDYVQHDNQFCMSCHLMADPFARFEKSAHRGLGCKACHRPSIIERSKMGLTQILEMPDSITHHAEVPNERCAECHINGNPQEWKLIANSVGHRLHLESGNPNLKNIQCVDCHGSGIHEFAPVDRTCARSGCHENTQMRLGQMSRLTIHCASCHDFTKPVPASVAAGGLNQEITPRGVDCFSCHAMRERVAASIPADEPHNAVCGTCHNPHIQRAAVEAVKSCSAGGCHARVDTVSPMHRGLASGVLQECTTCHKAHDWHVKADACTSCHAPDDLDGGTRPIKHITRNPARMAVGDVVLLPLRLSIGVVAQLAAFGEPFRHTAHKSVACKACHSSEDGHGVLRIRTVTDCNGCHHSTRSQARCTACHAASRLKPLTRTISASIAQKTVTRTLPFAHSTHSRASCVSCHNNAASMRAVVACSSCHQDHHTELRDCTSCHANAAAVAQHTREAHVSCSAAGCHQTPIGAALRTQRSVCLACHSDKRNHEPAGDCASCHMIPNRKANVRAAR